MGLVAEIEAALGNVDVSATGAEIESRTTWMRFEAPELLYGRLRLLHREKKNGFLFDRSLVPHRENTELARSIVFIK